MSSPVVWNRLIRFVDTNDKTYYGEPIVPFDNVTVDQLLADGTLEAKVITGDPLTESAVITDQVVKVAKLLAPLAQTDIPIIKCVGLNYKAHTPEAAAKIPPYPSIFIKPSHAHGDAYIDVTVPKVAHDTLDYEGELAIVIGKTGKDIPADKVSEYIAGYTVADDVSNRQWQTDPKFAGIAPQWCFCKGFDNFSPLGPAIVSNKLLGDRPALNLITKVNGEVRQDANTSDLVFGVPEIVSFISQGTTIEKGTVILTGTPAGVAMGMKEPKWLKDGDVVDIEIAQIGRICNKFVFA
ncbi:hypothetical protein K492DRAFT_239737 [Lichtheimia hyalospora FSU 10163]|nr:hypothetical protein K492DRAFT_239737 [Lichtheimia hyalospora FSU 10163]